MDEPRCGKCGGVMTPKNARNRPDLFLHDQCLPQELIDQQADASHERREALVRRACLVMGWDYHTSPAFGAIRKVAVADAVAVGLDKLAAMLDEIEQLRVVLRGVHEMAEEELRRGCIAPGTLIYQIEADTRSVLKAEVPNGQ